MPANCLNATVVARHTLDDHLAIMRIRPDSGRIEPFQPGQFATLGLPRLDLDPGAGAAAQSPRLIRRAYSIASSADVSDHLEFFVVKVDHGKLTPQLFEVPEGGRVWMSERCNGLFTLNTISPGRDLVMIATGTGVAPFISMLRTSWSRHAEGAPLPWRRCALLYSCRYERELGYRAELEQAAADRPDFVYLPTLTRANTTSAWPGLRGRVQAILDPGSFHPAAGFPLDPEQVQILLCGNPAMIESVRILMQPLGFTPATKTTRGNLHYERYW